ncbi:MAG: M1 family aminopeptidase [Chitinophagales bacterium]
MDAFAQTADSIQPLPALNQQRESKINVKHIAIDLKFDWKKKTAYGKATLQLSLLKATDIIHLDAAMLTINSIILSNGKALKYNYDGSDKNDALEIILDKMYNVNETLIISIDYHTNHINHADPNNIWGSFGKGIRFFEPTSTTPNKRKQIWSSGEPESNRYWFPCYDAPNAVRTTEFTATVEKPLIVISNGTLVKTIENTDDSRTFHYKSDVAYPNYLTSFIVGEYTDIKQKSGNIDLHTFAYPDEKAAAEATIVRLPEMVDYFSKLTGVKYPYSTYRQVMVQDYPFPGLVGQHTTTTISDNMIDDFRTHADFFYLWDGVEAQSLASQWFGNLLMPKDWSHNWLNTAFSHYADGLFTDYKNGHDEFLTYYLTFDQNTTLSDWNNNFRHPIVTQNYDNVQTFASDNYARIRGALVLRMLRKQIGDEKWFKAIQYYVKTNANKIVTTKDFQHAIETVTGDSIGWFFDQWIYKMGHPVFEITKKYDTKKKQLILNVQQTQKIDSNNAYPQTIFFKGKVAVEIDGMIKEIWLKAQQNNTFIFVAPSKPKLINFDFEDTWIKEIKFEKSLAAYLYQLKNDKDVLGKWHAIDALVQIAKDEKSDDETKTKIYAAFRKTIQSNDYWRLRGYALSQLRSLLATPYDSATVNMLLSLIKNDKPWIRTGAITFLGMSRDSAYTKIYLNALNDPSDRVINAAANALGKTKSSKAFDALIQLENKPSWKSQSKISMLNGLKELADPRAFDIAYKTLADIRSPRWWLATPIWDYPIAAAQTLVALGKNEAAYPMIFERFQKSLDENDYNDIFSNILLIATLADARGQEAFDLLKEKFKDDANAMIAVEQYETQFKETIKKP